MTPDDWRALIAAQDADPDWPTPYLLGVLDTAHGFATFDDAIVAEMVDTYRARAQAFPVVKSAIVAQRQFDASTAIPNALGGTKLRVISFADLRTACAWLGVDAELLQRVVDELRAEIRTNDENGTSSN